MHRARRIMPREARLAPEISLWSALDRSVDLNQRLDRLARPTSNIGPASSRRKERYLISACTVITEVPEAAGP